MLSHFLENDIVRYAMLAALFLGVVLLVFAVSSLLGERSVARGRLGEEDLPIPRAVPAGQGSLRADATRSRWLSLVEAIERSGLSLGDTKDEVLRTRLAAAGFTQSWAPRTYTLTRLVLLFALPVGLLGLLWLTGNFPQGLRLYLLLFGAALLGLYGPSLFIRAKADRRQQDIINGFPDALDLMLVCVEAGLGMEAAFNRVGMEMTQSHPLIAEQLGAVVLELRAGRSREDALRRMSDRSGSDEIRAFSTLLIQSTKLGSSIAATLRIYAGEMRERRRMRAEEKAHRLPVLLSVPLVGCMLPTMIGVLMLPAVIMAMRTLMPALRGGH